MMCIAFCAKFLAANCYKFSTALKGNVDGVEITDCDSDSQQNRIFNLSVSILNRYISVNILRLFECIEQRFPT